MPKIEQQQSHFLQAAHQAAQAARPYQRSSHRGSELVLLDGAHPGSQSFMRSDLVDESVPDRRLRAEWDAWLEECAQEILGPAANIDEAVQQSIPAASGSSVQASQLPGAPENSSMAKNQLCAIAFDCFSMSDTTKLPTFACVNDVALNREDWRERSGLGVAEKEKVLEIYGVSYHILRAFASRFFRTASRDEYISAEGKVEVEAFEQFLKELATFIGTAAALTPELRLLPIDREHGGCQIGIDVSTAEAIRSKILAMRERNVACAMAFDCHLMLGEGYKIPPAKFARLNEFLWSTREWIHKGTLAGIVRWDVVCTHGVSYDRLKESVLDEFGPAGIAQFISEKGEVNVGALVPILAAHAASLCSRDGGVRRLGAADRSHINPPALQSSFKQ